MGVYPKRNAGSAFPAGKAAEEQFFRTITPDVGKFDVKTVTDAMVKLFEKTAGVFVTHSAGGLIGWTTAMQSPNVKGIIAIEPSGFPFPEESLSETIKNGFGDVAPIKVPEEQFAKLTKIPIVIYFGDFIPDQPDGTQGGDQWHARLKMAGLFTAEVNKRGGDAKVVRLPQIGIKGNTHFPMFDMNNQEVADEMARWLEQHTF
ncbi:hypothetical protein [Neisseria sp.]|uniref:hypothetical protein n=1 Tax=Neisseria sp. TaxID=192066 RepID=UPI0026DB3CA4|nr:hypothetical protein [Neisseria sp.]MDO4228044.1 hypothetical protein [Neisseria sp.]